ncbi:MAG: phosphotransferase [Actinopolymorphaceae bacterium]
MTATKPPELAMLWEADDPSLALDKRFGFTDLGQATRWLGDVLATHWGVEVVSWERFVISAGNALVWLTTDTQRLLAKWSVVSRLHPRLAEFARLTDWLGRRGMPVSAPIPSIDGILQVETGGVSLCLQRVADGAHLDVSDPAQVYAAGVALADLHLALAEYPFLDSMTTLDVRSQPEPLVARLSDGIESTGTNSAGTNPARAEAIGALRAFLGTRRSDPSVPGPAQLIHRDFRSANVLFTGNTVTAVLDFEEVKYDFSVVDLAHSAVLLGTQFRNWAPVPPETHEVFVAGYRSVRSLSESEDAWLAALMLWGTVHFVPAGDDPAGWGTSAKALAAALR